MTKHLCYVCSRRCIMQVHHINHECYYWEGNAFIYRLLKLRYKRSCSACGAKYAGYSYNENQILLIREFGYEPRDITEFLGFSDD